MRKVALALCAVLLLAALPIGKDQSMQAFFTGLIDMAYPYQQVEPWIDENGISAQVLEDWVEAVLPWDTVDSDTDTPSLTAEQTSEAVAQVSQQEEHFTGVPVDHYVTVQETAPTINTNVSLAELKTVYDQQVIQNYEKTVKLYNYDSESMRPTPEIINGSAFMETDVTLKESDLEGPKVLIFHTHGHEGYIGKEEYGILDVGEYLKQILEQNYGIGVLHHTEIYDEGGINGAYTRVGESIPQILAENPSIQVVIDMHRDGVGEDTRLVTNVEGTDVAKVMLVTGVSQTFDENGNMQPIDYLPNENLQSVLSLGFQLKMASDALYPEFMRPLYLSSWRYSTYMAPLSMLLEVGAQTNTLEEAKAAMVPFAKVLMLVLNGA